MRDADLSALATGRASSLFDEDVALRRDEIAAAVEGRRLLVIGGAGSIGSATVEQLLPFAPQSLHVVDQNENALAELVRTLRSRPEPISTPDFRTLPLNYGSIAFQSMLRDEGPYDLVLNFAAIKHVRSEKDVYSILQMFETNIVNQAALVEMLRASGFRGRYFSVSTDKAANPTSMMGASKRVMEHVMFDRDLAGDLDATVTSARFANVAFSNGSLLQSFGNRLALGQPVAAPGATRRYFVSLEESGQICLLAATTAPRAHMLIPRLDPETALVDLQSIAEGFLRANGFEPSLHRDERDACAAVARDRERGRWPLLVSELSTSGEKPYEEFVGEDEEAIELGYRSLLAVAYRPLTSRGAMPRLLEAMDAAFADARKGTVTKERLRHILEIAEPRFGQTHRETGLNLDQRV